MTETAQPSSNPHRQELPELEQYPEVQLVTGAVKRVDRAGLIVGRINGFCRVEYRQLPPLEADIRAAQEWLSRCVRTKTPSLNSYSLKHAAERWRGKYVPNGAMIIALDRAGFELHPERGCHAQLNVMVAIHRRLYNKLPETSPSRRAAVLAPAGWYSPGSEVSLCR